MDAFSLAILSIVSALPTMAIADTIVRREITIWGAIQKKVNVQTNTQKAKELKAMTIAIV